MSRKLELSKSVKGSIYEYVTMYFRSWSKKIKRGENVYFTCSVEKEGSWIEMNQGDCMLPSRDKKKHYHSAFKIIKLTNEAEIAPIIIKNFENLEIVY